METTTLAKPLNGKRIPASYKTRAIPLEDDSFIYASRTVEDCRILPFMPSKGKKVPNLIEWGDPYDPSIERESIIRRGENLLLFGLPKCRKSFLLDLLLSSFFCKNEFINMGFTAKPPDDEDWVILRFDTEQSDDEVYMRAHRFYKWCGYDPLMGIPDERYQVYYLQGLDPKDRIRKIWEVVNRVEAEGRKVAAVAIDQIIDLTYGGDDKVEAQKVVSFFHALNAQFKCSIIATMHSNRTGRDTNGVAGSLFDKKFETSIRVEKDDEGISKMSPKFTRRGSGNFWLRFAQNDDDPVMIEYSHYNKTFSSLVTAPSGIPATGKPTF